MGKLQIHNKVHQSVDLCASTYMQEYAFSVGDYVIHRTFKMPSPNIYLYFNRLDMCSHLVSEHVQSFSLLPALLGIMSERKVTHTEIPSLCETEQTEICVLNSTRLTEHIPVFQTCAGNI